MDLKEIFQKVLEEFKEPETLEEAIEYVNNTPSCQIAVEDAAFKQVILNILVAAGIVSEKDFNDSIRHFREVFIKDFAVRLLQSLGKAIPADNDGVWVKVDEDNSDNQDSNDDDWDDGEPAGEA